ncbi:unnamed protein product [Effrenium voratum]|nr:unnamed protein product [Effrenium voratum]
MSVNLDVECGHTREGDQVYLVGSGPLGGWDPSKALSLETGPQLFPRWKGQLDTTPEGTECKLIIRRKEGHIDWEPGANRSFPSLSSPSKLCMAFGKPGMDLVPMGGYEAAPGPAMESTLSIGEMEMSRANTRKDFRQRLIDMEFSTNIEERYEIDKVKLGEGGFGTVRRARDKETGARRAVKFIVKSGVANVDHLRREIQITQKMDHPNIVRLFAVYEDRCNLYLVMELCEGGELFDRLVEEKYLTEPIVRKVMKQVFSSISYCHGKDVVHRDLKPENYILLDRGKGVDATPLKLIDFGLAQRCRDGQQLKSAVGTAFYVAPEVMAGKYAKEVDVWGCGVLMYCLHCGSPPFYGRTDVDVLRKVKKGQYSLDGPIWEPVSKAAKDLISRCLEMDPSKRISALDALKHRWFAAGKPESLVKLQADVLSNLRGFSVANRFKKAALTAVAYQLTAEEQRELREAFMKLDANGDGYLSFQEIKTGLEQHILDGRIPNLAQILEGIDTDNDGKIEYTEFIAAAMDQRLQMNEAVCWRAFKSFDKDGDGTITLEELRKVLHDDELQSQVPATRSASSIFMEMDSNKDGSISFEDKLHEAPGVLVHISNSKMKCSCIRKWYCRWAMLLPCEKWEATQHHAQRSSWICCTAKLCHRGAVNPRSWKQQSTKLMSPSKIGPSRQCSEQFSGGHAAVLPALCDELARSDDKLIPPVQHG